MMRNFLRDEQGQDLIEYTLLLAFVALASAATLIGGFLLRAVLIFGGNRSARQPGDYFRLTGGGRKR